jgi:hypothetical protein
MRNLAGKIGDEQTHRESSAAETSGASRVARPYSFFRERVSGSTRRCPRISGHSEKRIGRRDAVRAANSLYNELVNNE